MSTMGWGDIPAGGQTAYLQLQAGDNRVRVVSPPFQVNVHWEETIEGSKQKVICPGPGCPICKVGRTPGTRYQALVLNRATAKVEILEGGPQIFRQVKDYAVDPDYGDPSKYDIKIKKEGSGRDTRYSVKAAPNKTELTPEEQALVNDATPLAELNAPKTIEEIKAMNLLCLGASMVDSGLNTPPVGAGGPVSDINDDDWDSL